MLLRLRADARQVDDAGGESSALRFRVSGLVSADAAAGAAWAGADLSVMSVGFMIQVSFLKSLSLPFNSSATGSRSSDESHKLKILIF